MTKNAFSGWHARAINCHLTRSVSSGSGESFNQARRIRAKTLLVMKLTLLLITAFVLNASAISFAQNLTFSGKNIPLEKVFSEIKKQTGYSIIYTSNTLNGTSPVTINVQNAPLAEFLTQLLKDQPVTSIIEYKTITIIRKKDAVSPLLSTPYQPLTGVIRTQDGQLLPGASIRVKGSSTGTYTDTQGRFTINTEEGDVLIVTYLGFATQEIKVTKAVLTSGQLGITMQRSEVTIQEVVVNKGYYTENIRLSTGSVAHIGAADIEKQPVNNALQALQGRMAGVFVTQSSGLPNSPVTLEIRGTNSVQQSREPLYIIDGVPYNGTMLQNVSAVSGMGDAGPFSFLNPAGIESIDILKDADATAIYGSRGANGVVLITTRKGKSGMPKFTINAYTGFSKTPGKADLMDRDQYLEMRNEGFRNTGVVKTVNNAPDLLLWDTTRNEDWQKRLLGKANQTTDIQVSMTGGSGNTTYRIFGGYNKTTPPFPGSFKSDKISAGMTLSTTNRDGRLTLQTSVNYLSDNTYLPNYNPLTGILLAPIAPEPFNPDGTINYKDYSTNNPFPGFYTNYKGKTGNFVTSAALSYRILSGLTFRVTGGYNNTQVNGMEQSTIKSQIGNPFITVPSGNAAFSYNFTNSWIVEPQLSYHGEWKKSSWDALTGTTYQEGHSNGQLIYGSGYTNDVQLNSLAAAATISKGNAVFAEKRFVSVYARLNYNYDDKFLLNLTGRRDGSSRFGPDKKFGNFGAVGAGWIFTKETFIHDHLPFLSFGKIRASYGIAGNEPGTDYQYLSLHQFITNGRNYQDAQAIYPGNLLAADFAWEQVKKGEVGLELGFVKDRIFTTFSYFKNRSSNQLVAYDLPDITGFSSVFVNRDATVQNAGLEVTIATKNIAASNFTWNTNVNFTTHKNKLVAFPNIEKTPYRDQLVIGRPLSIQKRYHAAGVDPATGVYQFYDAKGNLTFEPGIDDLTQVISTDPKFYGGIQNTFTYKNFGLDFFLYFVKQTGFNYYYISLQAPGRSYYGDGNQNVAVLDRWQKPGDIKPFQKFTSSSGNITTAYAYQQYSDAAYTDASYIRLKNVSLSYSLPQLWLKKAHMEQVKLYIQTQNVFTISSYKGLDPEGQGVTPPLSIWTGGVQINF